MTDNRMTRIIDTMLDRTQRVIAAIASRYPPVVRHPHCPKAACRRSRTCRRDRQRQRSSACIAGHQAP